MSCTTPQMETNDQCRYDYLTVKDSDGVQLHKLCGKNSKNIEVELQDRHILDTT